MKEPQEKDYGKIGEGIDWAAYVQDLKTYIEYLKTEERYFTVEQIEAIRAQAYEHGFAAGQEGDVI